MTFTKLLWRKKMHNPLSLRGKKLLVTGASSGIGRVIAIECSRMGATLIIVGRNNERLLKTFQELSPSEDHNMIKADLTNANELEIIASVSNLDGVVLCAGKALTLPVQFSNMEKMNEIFDINYFSTVELLRLLYKKKNLNKHASVVAISSLGGTKIFSGSNSIYGASKAALSSYMKFCAKEFSIRKIRVNTICPGMVDTPLIHRGTITEDQLKKDEATYPLGRYGRPLDIAYMTLFLLSDASSWITGQDFIVDGGLSIR